MNAQQLDFNVRRTLLSTGPYTEYEVHADSSTVRSEKTVRIDYTRNTYIRLTQHTAVVLVFCNTRTRSIMALQVQYTMLARRIDLLAWLVALYVRPLRHTAVQHK